MSSSTWNAGARSFHWLIAVLIFVAAALGWLAESAVLSPGKLQLFIWHKSFGITVLALAVLRLAWRLLHRPPEEIEELSATEQRLAGLGHAARVIAVQARFAGWLEQLIEVQFRRLVTAATNLRYVTVACAIVALLSSVGIVGSGRLPFSFFPPLESDQVIASLTMPLGTPAAVTDAAVKRLEETAREVKAHYAEAHPGAPPVTHVLSSVGGGAGGGGPFDGGDTGGAAGHIGEVVMQLTGSTRASCRGRSKPSSRRSRRRSIGDSSSRISRWTACPITTRSST